MLAFTALALTWELVKGSLPASMQKATIQLFDQILGLGLADWQPSAEAIPEQIWQSARQRQAARNARNWTEADRLREQITAAGYEIQDKPQGPQVRLVR